MAKKKNPVYKSPVGIAQYPYLTKPDTQFSKGGDYKVSLILNATEHAKFLDGLKKAAQDKFDETLVELKERKKAKAIKALTLNLPFEEIYDDEGNETDDVKVSFKMKRVVEPKDGDAFTQEPNLFDSAGNDLPKSVKIGGGSKMMIAYQLSPYYMPSSNSAGVSLRLKAALIKELVEFGNASAASMFGDDVGGDDGFVYEGGSDEEPESNDFDDADDAEDGDY